MRRKAPRCSYLAVACGDRGVSDSTWAAGLLFGADGVAVTVSVDRTAGDASLATATTSNATTVSASMQDICRVPSRPANVPEVSRGRRLPCLMSMSPAIGRMVHRVRSAPAARQSSSMAHPCPRGCISRRSPAILAYRATALRHLGVAIHELWLPRPHRISTGCLVSQSVGMAPDHAATGRLQHGRYNSASTKAAPEKSSYHPCRYCAQGRFSAPSLPLPRQTAYPRGRVVTGRRLHSAHHRAAHTARPTNTTAARIVVSLARVASMPGRQGLRRPRDAPAALDGHQPHQRRAAGTVHGR